MSISMDGIAYKGNLEVPYGQEFPEPRKSDELVVGGFGTCLVYITHVGVPEWNGPLSVSVPIHYYITQVLEPSKEYVNKQKRKKIGLKLIK